MLVRPEQDGAERRKLSHGRTRQLLVSGRRKPETSSGEHAVAGATDVREKAKGMVPCSDVRFRLTGRTNSGRSRVAGRGTHGCVLGPRCLECHLGASNTRDPESAASTREGRGASRDLLPMPGKAVQRRFVGRGWYRGQCTGIRQCNTTRKAVTGIIYLSGGPSRWCRNPRTGGMSGGLIIRHPAHLREVCS